MNSFNKDLLVEKKIAIQSFLLATLFCLPFVGLAVPYGLPLLPILSLISLATLCSNQNRSFFYRMYCVDWLFMLKVAYFVLISFFYFDELDYLLRKDIYSSISLVSCAICFSFVFNNKYSLKKIVKYIESYYPNVMLLVALVSLFKMIMWTQHSVVICQSDGTSLSEDYNMYALALLVALFIVIRSAKKVEVKLFYSAFFVFCILCSGSRSGVVVLVLYFLGRLAWLLIEYLSTIASVFRHGVREKITLTWLCKCLVVLTCCSSVLVVGYGIKNYELSSDLMNQTYVQNVLPTSSSEKIRGNTFRKQYRNLFRRLKTIVSSGNTGILFQRGRRMTQGIELVKNASLAQLVFGQGFSYHDYYKKINGLRLLDYPHNVFFSTLLAEGIVGLFLLSILVLRTLYFSIILFYSNKYRWIFDTSFCYLLYLSAFGDTLVSHKPFLLLTLLSFYLVTPTAEKLSSGKAVNALNSFRYSY